MSVDDGAVLVELVQQTESGHRLQGVWVNDEPWLASGAYLTLGDGSGEWQVLSVCRCIERADGTLDHENCFKEPSA